MDTYTNPIARFGDYADPFVLRHAGRYYLYCTNPDLRCWSSDDLVHWRAEGPVIALDTFPGLIPFAPEVTYADGVFYLLTSPTGVGHFVLTADTPTGPFKRVSGNVGHAIDGHVLIDDDGTWYVYWAGDEGIWGARMVSAVEWGEPVFTGVTMSGWTEGPFVVKYEGRYHLTATGIHYLNPAYRIDAWVSDRPLDGYEPGPYNPWLINTTGPVVGLGHSSTVRGPDLVSHWLAYHNLNPDRSRDLDIDRVVWADGHMVVLGPSRVGAAPEAPDRACRWVDSADFAQWDVARGDLRVEAGCGVLTDGPPPSGAALAVWGDSGVPGCYTTEHTWSAEAATYGVAGLAGGAVTWAIEVDAVTGVLRVRRNAAAIAAVPLPTPYTHGVTHCLRVESDAVTRVWLDNRLMLTTGPLPAEALGYQVTDGTLRILHAALTRTTEARAGRTAPKPAPGRFPAALSATDQPLTYTLLVAGAGPHNLYVTGRFEAGTTLGVRLDDAGETLHRIESATALATVPLDLTPGPHTLTLAPEPATRLDLIEIRPAPASREGYVSPAPPALTGYGKHLVGDPYWHDYTLAATVRLGDDATDPGAHADLLFRVAQPAEGGEGKDPVLGLNFFCGYSLQFHPDALRLARHAYDETIVAEVRVTLPDGPHKVIIDVRGSRITARAGALTLTYDDPHPHPIGQAGLRAAGRTITLSDLTITLV